MGLATLVEESRGHGGMDLAVGDEDARFVAEMLFYEITEDTLDQVRRGSGMIVVMSKGKGEVFHAGTTNWVAGLIDRDPYVEPHHPQRSGSLPCCGGFAWMSFTSSS